MLGEWKINNLVIDTLFDNYELTPLNNEQYSNYGNHILIDTNGTFQCWYTAPCGNDCFVYSNGRFVVSEDSINIEFILDDVRYMKECSGRISPYNFPLNLGSFAIKRENSNLYFDKIKL